MTDYAVDKIIRSKRKTLALQVTHDGMVIVRAPKNAPQKAINSFIARYSKWVEKKKTQAHEFNKTNPPKTFVDGERFIYLGEFYKLSLVDNPNIAIRFDAGFYLDSAQTKKARSLFIDWYIRRAKPIITERVGYYTALTGLTHNRLRITNAKSRWGSCSANNNIRFSWRLVMAPMNVIDYVVVHELVHIQIKNHSKTFWDKVENTLPDYRQHRQWLKDNGRFLDF
jgi:predicted metal-dependent hydrolase